MDLFITKKEFSSLISKTKFFKITKALPIKWTNNAHFGQALGYFAMDVMSNCRSISKRSSLHLQLLISTRMARKKATLNTC